MKFILVFFLALASGFPYPACAQIRALRAGDGAPAQEGGLPAPAPLSILPSGDFTGLVAAGGAQVEQVLDPLRLRLTDGRIVQLAPLDVPDFDPYDPGERTAEALAFVRALLTGRQVRLYQTPDSAKGRVNRMGYLLAQVEVKKPDAPNEPGIWVQGALLAGGYARVRPSTDNTDMAAQMLALQADAQAQKRGVWADPRYGVKNPDTAAEAEGGFATVEGRIVATAAVGNILYLNFGPDWRTDFTVGIVPEVRRKLAAAGTPATGLSGKTVRVQGWVRDYNGPYMELAAPAWMEILPEGGKSSTLDKD